MARTVSRSANSLGTRGLKALLSLGLRGDTDIECLPGRDTPPDELMEILRAGAFDRECNGGSLLDEILSPATSLLALYQLKEVSKRLICAEVGARREAATLLYLATIAQGFARHGRNISAIAPATRTHQFRKLAESLATEPLGSIFRAGERACVRCGVRGGPS